MDEDFLNEEDFEEVQVLDDDMIDDDGDNEMEGATDLFEDDSKMVFSKHSASVFCCDVNKGGKYAVTGGEDDTAYVWNIETGDVIMECTGHADSVVYAKFNCDSTLLATGDMSGKIKIWKLESSSEILSLETSGDLKWMLWHKSTNVLFAGSDDGFMWMWKIPSGNCKSFFGIGRSCETGIVLSDGVTAACGYEDGTLKFWNLKTGQDIHSVSGMNSHKDSILCLDCDSSVSVATGSSDGTSKLISSKTGKVLTTLQCNTEKKDDSTDSVESVKFCQTQPLLATGTVSGCLGIWDLTKQTNRFQIKQEDGIVKVTWDPNEAFGSILYTAGLDGIVRMWDARTGESEFQWRGHQESILDMVLWSDSILTTSDDLTARLFAIKR